MRDYEPMLWVTYGYAWCAVLVGVLVGSWRVSVLAALIVVMSLVTIAYFKSNA